jgi:hypothetical protein
VSKNSDIYFAVPFPRNIDTNYPFLGTVTHIVHISPPQNKVAQNETFSFNACEFLLKFKSLHFSTISSSSSSSRIRRIVFSSTMCGLDVFNPAIISYICTCLTHKHTSYTTAVMLHQSEEEGFFFFFFWFLFSSFGRLSKLNREKQTTLTFSSSDFFLSFIRER